MWQSIIVLEDFYDDAMAIRNMALSLEYPDPGTAAAYSGRNSNKALLNQGIVNVFSRMVGEPLVPSPQSAVGHFRIGLGRDTGRQDIHVDPYRDWAAIIYFNPPEQCQNRPGTCFWRHKRLGIDAMPRDAKDVEKYGFNSYEEMRVAIAEQDGIDRSKWEPTLTIPMRFNRCVLFRSWLWHSHAENFGDDRETGRLIQVFFFDLARRAQQQPQPIAGAAMPVVPPAR
jgi:hypothetical protein